MNLAPPRFSLLLGSFALLAAPAVQASEDAASLERMRWDDRVFLVVADAGPARVPFKKLVEDPRGFFWKRRVGTAMYVGDRRYLITTRSVVGDSRMVEVFHDEGYHVVARVVGTDRHMDLALLESAEDLPGTEGLEPLTSAPANPGDRCMVLGNAYGRALSACRGMVGEQALVMVTGVPVSVLRLEVPIYPGDSGGPVLDPTGRFLGLVTAVAGPRADSAVLEKSDEFRVGDLRSKPAGSSGLAIPAEHCTRAWKELREFGHVRRGFLGVHLSPTQVDVKGGVRVLQVMSGGPAELYGIRPGDRILEFGTQPVTDPRQFCALVTQAVPNIQLDVRLVRDEEEHLITVRLGEAIRQPGIIRFSTQVPPVPRIQVERPAQPTETVDAAPN